MSYWIADTNGARQYPLLQNFASVRWDYKGVYDNFDSITQTNVLEIFIPTIITEIAAKTDAAEAETLATNEVAAILDDNLDTAVPTLTAAFSGSSLSVANKRVVLREVSKRASLVKGASAAPGATPTSILKSAFTFKREIKDDSTISTDSGVTESSTKTLFSALPAELQNTVIPITDADTKAAIISTLSAGSAVISVLGTIKVIIPTRENVRLPTQEGDNIFFQVENDMNFIITDPSGVDRTFKVVQDSVSGVKSVVFDGTEYIAENVITFDNGTSITVTGIGSVMFTVGSGAEGSGDPHISTLQGEIYELPNKVATYRMLQGQDIMMNMNTRKTTDTEKDDIIRYYKKHVGEKNVDKLITSGVFFNELWLESEGETLYYNYLTGEGNTSSDTYFKLSQVRNKEGGVLTNDDRMKEISLTFNHSVYGPLKISLQKFENPQIKYGINIGVTYKKDLTGLLVKEYLCNTMEVETLKSTNNVTTGKLGKNKVLTTIQKIPNRKNTKSYLLR